MNIRALSALTGLALAALACGFTLNQETPTPGQAGPTPTRRAQATAAATEPGPADTSQPPTEAAPPATAEPVVNFSVDSGTVAGEQCTTLRWSTANVSEVRLSGGEYGAAPGQGMVGEDTRPACPAPETTVTYTLRVVDRAGNVIERSASVQNTAAARRPPQVRNTAVFGASAGLVWNFIPLDDGILQLQVQADPNAFTEQSTPVTADGDGIQEVQFVVSQNGEVFTQIERGAAYCLLGGNGPCNPLTFEDGVYKWQPGGAVIAGGDYFVDITITLLDGQTRTLSASFSIELP